MSSTESRTEEAVVTIATDNKLSSTAAVPEEPPAPAPPALQSSPEPTTRNQAPGIPDRRKSLRPGKTVRGGRKSSAGSKRISIVADMASEMRIKDDDDDKQVWKYSDDERFETRLGLTRGRRRSKTQLPPRDQLRPSPKSSKSRPPKMMNRRIKQRRRSRTGWA